MSLRVLMEAEEEVLAAAGWYNDQFPGLLPQETVVLAVAHASRRPNHWRGRRA